MTAETANVQTMIAAALARPKRLRVTTTYACGKTKHHDVSTEGQAENWATGERRKIGRDLVDRVSGKNVRVVSVDVVRFDSLVADAFARLLRAVLSSAEFDEMKRLNETAEYADGCCASQNYLDANEVMAAAFEETFGRPFDFSDADVDLWNASWNVARAKHIGQFKN